MNHFSKKIKKPDTVLVLAALAALLVSVWMIFDDQGFFKGSLSRTQHAIGYISVNQGDVRFKEDQALQWFPAHKNQSLIYDDSIFVGARSKALLQIGNSPLEVTENSLIVLRKVKSFNILNLSFGTLSGQLSPNEKLIIESENGKRIEVNTKEKAKIVVSTSKSGETRIRVLSGQAEVHAEGKTQSLSAGALFLKNKSTVAAASEPPLVMEPKVLPKVLKPVDGQLYHREFPMDPLSLEFDVPKDFTHSWFQIFDQNDLKTPLVNKAVAGRQASLSLPDGGYVIRVRGMKTSGPPGPWSKLSLFMVESRISIDPNGVSAPTLSEQEKPQPPVKTKALASREKPKSPPEKIQPQTPAPQREVAAQNAERTQPAPMEAQIQTKAPAAPTSLSRNYEAEFSLGFGSDYLQFEQSGIQISSLNYASLRGPSFSLSAEVNWNSGYGAKINYAQFPGEIRSDTVTLQNKNFEWKSLHLEGKYRVPVDFGPGSHRHFGYLLGVARHHLPYVQTTDYDQAEIRNYELTSATVGVEYTALHKTKWLSEFYLRYSHPLSQQESNGDSLKITPQFSFDGSLGVKYKLLKNLNLGVFWYGEYQHYGYRMINGINGDWDTGINSLFFSNLELRMGYTY